jgi:hypothetical protein
VFFQAMIFTTVGQEEYFDDKEEEKEKSFGI